MLIISIDEEPDAPVLPETEGPLSIDEVNLPSIPSKTPWRI
ncbi:hypothetical protein ACT691_05760 [Vibrio metschnikovii]